MYVLSFLYKRLGTLSLLAGIDLLTGEAIPLVSETHKGSDFIEFLKILDKKYPSQDTIRIILDGRIDLIDFRKLQDMMYSLH